MSEVRIEQIMEGLATRDPQEAWSTFLEDYAPAIFQVVRHFEAESDNAADCFQFICERLCEHRFRRLRRFKIGGAAKFSTWLRVVARNLCLDWRRKQFGRRRVFRSVARLSPLDQAVFQQVHERGVTPSEALVSLTQRFPYLTGELLSEAIERVNKTLTTNQNWLLRTRLAFVGPRAGAGTETDYRQEIIDPQPDPEKLALLAERTTILKRALGRLSDKERLFVHLRFEEHLTLDQIAKLLDLGNAQRADRQLKQILASLRLEFDSQPASGKSSASSVKAM